MSPTLDRSPLLLEFKRILGEEASGTLTVRADDCTRELVFFQGKLTRVDSTRPQEGLTTILQDCGLISGDVLEEDDEQFAELLVSRGVLQRGEVDFARLHRMRIIALSLFSITQGEWTFHAQKTTPESSLGAAIHLADILSDAVSSVETHYYFREIFSRSHPRFVAIPPHARSRVYERQSSLFARMQHLGVPVRAAQIAQPIEPAVATERSGGRVSTEALEPVSNGLDARLENALILDTGRDSAAGAVLPGVPLVIRASSGLSRRLRRCLALLRGRGCLPNHAANDGLRSIAEHLATDATDSGGSGVDSDAPGEAGVVVAADDRLEDAAARHGMYGLYHSARFFFSRRGGRHPPRC